MSRSLVYKKIKMLTGLSPEYHAIVTESLFAAGISVEEPPAAVRR
jgi:hypothetical protein